MGIFKRRKPALEQSTSEHLTTAMLRFRDELRRAGAGMSPDPQERAALAKLVNALRRMRADPGLDPALREAIEDVATTTERLLEERDSAESIVDIVGG